MICFVGQHWNGVICILSYHGVTVHNCFAIAIVEYLWHFELKIEYENTDYFSIHSMNCNEMDANLIKYDKFL